MTLKSTLHRGGGTRTSQSWQQPHLLPLEMKPARQLTHLHTCAPNKFRQALIVQTTTASTASYGWMSSGSLQGAIHVEAHRLQSTEQKSTPQDVHCALALNDVHLSIS